MKRKAIYLAVLTAVIVAVGFLSIKKVNAYDYAVYDTKYYISSRDQQALGFSAYFALVPNSSPQTIMYISADNTSSYFHIDYYYIDGYYYMYLNLYQLGEDVSLGRALVTSPFAIISVTMYNSELYLLIDNVEYESITTGQYEVDYHSISQVYIEALEDYGFLEEYYDNEIFIQLSKNNNRASNCLLQALYIEVGDTMNSIYNAFDDCVNYDYLTYWLQYGYNSGYDVGYDYGVSEGEDVGYTNGYDDGYHDGELGENALSPMWTILSSIATGIGQILGLELGYGIKLGTLLFVPLFFAVVGFILWIWRH